MFFPSKIKNLDEIDFDNLSDKDWMDLKKQYSDDELEIYLQRSKGKN